MTEKVKDAVGEDEETGEDLGERVGRGLRGFVRWVEGPGAPEAAPKPSRVRPVIDEEDDESVEPLGAAPGTEAPDADATEPEDAAVGKDRDEQQG